MIAYRWRLLQSAVCKKVHQRSLPILRFSTKSSNETHYEVLGIPLDATDSEIKSAFFRLSKKYHPDKSTSKDAHSRFVEINEAYSVLSKASSRRDYDSRIRRFHPQTGAWDHDPLRRDWPGYQYPPHFSGRQRPGRGNFSQRPGESTQEMYNRWFNEQINYQNRGVRYEGWDQPMDDPNARSRSLMLLKVFSLFTALGLVFQAIIVRKQAEPNQRLRYQRITTPQTNKPKTPSEGDEKKT